MNSKAFEVEFTRVFFSYKDEGERPDLKDISLVVKPGSLTAFIGKSGAGKTTLANLITGIFTPTSGQVTIEGQESEKFVLNNPGAVAFVPQRPSVFEGTLYENIALTQERTSSAEYKMLNLLEQLDLSEWFESLYFGLDTKLDDHKMSGGQLQRLGIARALFTDPKLLILDEPTSALDALTEKRISELLIANKGNVTIIVIAHRLSTIRSADIVYLLDNGQVDSSGKFEELISSSPKVATQAKLLGLI